VTVVGTGFSAAALAALTTATLTARAPATFAGLASTTATVTQSSSCGVASTEACFVFTAPALTGLSAGKSETVILAISNATARLSYVSVQPVSVAASPTMGLVGTSTDSVDEEDYIADDDISYERHDALANALEAPTPPPQAEHVNAMTDALGDAQLEDSDSDDLPKYIEGTPSMRAALRALIKRHRRQGARAFGTLHLETQGGPDMDNVQEESWQSAATHPRESRGTESSNQQAC
jgi:hypothetical protein